MMGRLPVAPRPCREELLSSWLGRVACRYGLDAASLVGALTDDDGGAPAALINDIAPTRKEIAFWEQACGLDPERLSRLALARRRPGRSSVWFASQGSPWSPSPMRSPPICRACFEADRFAGRDEHLRADWLLAERCVCPAHRQLLRDRCPVCRARLHVAFRLREGRARIVCGRCGQEVAGTGEEDRALIDALISLQNRVDEIVRAMPERRRRLEAALSTLWAPLDDPGAARPVLALWIDESGWRCPTEAQGAIGAPFPLGRLPVGLRIATLVAADAAFGLGDAPLEGASTFAAFLIRRAAPLRSFPERRRAARGFCFAGAAFADRIPTTRARNPDESGMAGRDRSVGAPPPPRSLAFDGKSAFRASGRSPPWGLSPPMNREAGLLMKRENPTPGVS